MLSSLLRPNDLCVCVQSGTFQHRFQEYRLRLGLFERHIKMIEHVHLGLIDPDQHQTYLDSLGMIAQVNLFCGKIM
jgi:aspartate aminotransferase-like enzyme